MLFGGCEGSPKREFSVASVKPEAAAFLDVFTREQAIVSSISDNGTVVGKVLLRSVGTSSQENVLDELHGASDNLAKKAPVSLIFEIELIVRTDKVSVAKDADHLFDSVLSQIAQRPYGAKTAYKPRRVIDGQLEEAQGSLHLVVVERNPEITHFRGVAVAMWPAAKMNRLAEQLGYLWLYLRTDKELNEYLSLDGYGITTNILWMKMALLSLGRQGTCQWLQTPVQQ